MIFYASASIWRSVKDISSEFQSLPSFGDEMLADRLPSRRAIRRGPAVPLVGSIRNPRSHRNKGIPAEMGDCWNILTETPRTREELQESLLEFARRGIDYLVVDGGDGTVRDVLTCGADIFGDHWPSLIVLPKGKTNALAVDLGLPNHWSLAEALAAAHKGYTVNRRPLRITPAKGSARAVQGFFLGTGIFSLATEAGQEAHRRGAFNSFAVGLTTLWGILQSLFGRAGNPWRRGTRTRIVDRSTGRALPRTGRGRPDERYMTVATTFERFPLGARPFGRNVAPGLKLAVLDYPTRWVVALVPAILYGFWASFLDRNGAQRFQVSEVDLDIGSAFILDGEALAAGRYILDEGPELTFVVP